MGIPCVVGWGGACPPRLAVEQERGDPLAPGKILIVSHVPQDGWESDAPDPDLLKLLLCCFRRGNGKGVDEGTVWWVPEPLPPSKTAR